MIKHTLKRKLVIIITIIICGTTLKAQTSDYCFQSDNTWTPLHHAVCFDSDLTFELGSLFAKEFNKQYKQPTYIITTNQDSKPKVIDSSFVMFEPTGDMKGISRISLNLHKNLRVSLATLPFDKNGYSRAQLVALAKTDGECQLIFDGFFEKRKIKTSDNTSIYQIQTGTKKIIVDNKAIELKMSLYYLDGLTLEYVEINDLMIKL